MRIAEVDSDAAGGGYYNCHIQTLDATDWNTDTADQLDDTGDSVVVLNLAEVGADRHALAAGNHILCWKVPDDEGNIRLVGFGWTEIDNVITELNINTTTFKFQTKKRDNVAVLATGDLSAYVDEHTGGEC